MDKYKRNEYVSIKPVEYDYAPPVDERSLPVIEVCCQIFGCGKILTRQEKLFGNKCIKHQKVKKLTFFGNY